MKKIKGKCKGLSQWFIKLRTNENGKAVQNFA